MDSTNHQEIARLLDKGEYDLVIKLCHEINDPQERRDIFQLLGQAYLRTGQAGLAVTCLEQAIQGKTDESRVFYDLGAALLKTGELNKAFNSFKKCYELEPGNPAVIENLAYILTRFGRYGEAINLLQQHLAKDCNQPGLYNCLGYAYERLGDLANAETSIRMAINYSHDSPEPFNNLGNILKARGRSREAIKAYRQALKLRTDFSGVHSNLLLCMNYIPSITPDEICQEHKKWASGFKQIEHVCKTPGRKSKGNKIRIGYVSPDFRSHPVVHFFLPILRNHDRNKFEIFCYAEVASPDNFSQEVAQLADCWINTCGMPDDELAKRICSDGIGILVDLAGHTENNRLGVFALKPSPVQVTYLGYPNTTGLDAIDYRLSDDVLDPEGSERFYTEKLVRLPEGFSCFSPPKFYPDVSSSPYLRKGSITFGSFNNPAKFNDLTFKCWGQILKAVPGSRLLFFRNVFGEEEKDNITAHFAKQGISRDRIIVMNRAQMPDSKLPPGRHYLRTMTDDVDICLDPFPWSGHTTACESLWMGVPVITLYGDRPASRLCASVLHQLELPYLVAKNIGDYVDIAKRLASETDLLSELRNSLRARMSSSMVCDGKEFTGIYEKMLENMLVERRQ